MSSSASHRMWTDVGGGGGGASPPAALVPRRVAWSKPPSSPSPGLSAYIRTLGPGDSPLEDGRGASPKPSRPERLGGKTGFAVSVWASRALSPPRPAGGPHPCPCGCQPGPGDLEHVWGTHSLRRGGVWGGVGVGARQGNHSTLFCELRSDCPDDGTPRQKAGLSRVCISGP